MKYVLKNGKTNCVTTHYDDIIIYIKEENAISRKL